MVRCDRVVRLYGRHAVTRRLEHVSPRMEHLFYSRRIVLIGLKDTTRIVRYALVFRENYGWQALASITLNRVERAKEGAPGCFDDRDLESALRNQSPAVPSITDNVIDGY